MLANAPANDGLETERRGGVMGTKWERRQSAGSHVSSLWWCQEHGMRSDIEVFQIYEAELAAAKERLEMAENSRPLSEFIAELKSPTPPPAEDEAIEEWTDDDRRALDLIRKVLPATRPKAGRRPPPELMLRIGEIIENDQAELIKALTARVAEFEEANDALHTTNREQFATIDDLREQRAERLAETDAIRTQLKRSGELLIEERKWNSVSEMQKRLATAQADTAMVDEVEANPGHVHFMQSKWWWKRDSFSTFRKAATAAMGSGEGEDCRFCGSALGAKCLCSTPPDAAEKSVAERIEAGEQVVLHYLQKTMYECNACCAAVFVPDETGFYKCVKCGETWVLMADKSYTPTALESAEAIRAQQKGPSDGN